MKKYSFKTFYEEFFNALEKEKVQYLLAGGLAVLLYGVHRFTADIDIIIDFSKKNLKRLSKVANHLSLIPKAPVKIEELSNRRTREYWQKSKNMIVFSLVPIERPFFHIDIFLNFPFNFSKIYAKRRLVPAGKTMISMIPPEQLIALKKMANRPLDRLDIQSLKRILELEEG